LINGKAAAIKNRLGMIYKRLGGKQLVDDLKIQ